MSFQLSSTIDANKIFLINRSDIEGRFDPKSYNKKNVFIQSQYAVDPLSKHFYLNPPVQLKGERIFTFVPMKNVCESSASIKKFDVIERSETKGFTPFQEGDFLFSKITPCMENGKMAIATNMPFFFGFGSTEFHVFREKSTSVTVYFLRVLFLIDSFRELAKAHFTGAAGQQRVPPEFLRSVKIPVPPQEVQAEIVAKMDAAYAAKKQKEAEAQALLDSIDGYLLGELGIELPEQEESTIQNRMFTRTLSEVSGNRFDPSFYQPKYMNISKAIGKVRHGRLKHIVNFSDDVWNQKDFFSDTFPYIEIGEVDLAFGELKSINDTSVANAPSRAKMIVKDGDILISTTRPSRGAIVRVKTSERILIASTGFAVVRDIVVPDVLPDYLYYFLRATISLTQMEQRSSGGNYPAITQDELGNLLIPLPDLNKQHAIVAHISSIRQQAKQLKYEAQEGLKQAKKEVEAMILGDSE